MTVKIITAVSYNEIQSLVATVLGTPTTTIGYGQIVTSVPVYKGQSISASNWSQLQVDINRCRVHQYGNTFVSSLLPGVNREDNILLATVTQYASSATNIKTDLLLADISNLSLIANTAISTRTSSWGMGGTFPSDAISCEISITWPNDLEKNKFLNTGGVVQWKLAHPVMSNGQNSNWSTFLDVPMCNIHRGTTTATSNMAAVAVDTLTSTYSTILSRSSTGYTANTYSIQIKQIANGYQIKITLTDGYTNANTDSVDAGTNVTFSHLISTVIMTDIISPTYSILTNF